MNRIEPTLCVEPRELVREKLCMVPHKHLIWYGEDAEDIGAVDSPPRQEQWWQYNAPVGACTATFQKVERFCCITVLSLLLPIFVCARHVVVLA